MPEYYELSDCVADYIGEITDTKILSSLYDAESEMMFLLVEDTSTAPEHPESSGIGFARFSPPEYLECESGYRAAKFAVKMRADICWASGHPPDIAGALGSIPRLLSIEARSLFTSKLDELFPQPQPGEDPDPDPDSIQAGRGVVSKLEDGSTLVTMLIPA